MGVWSYAFWIGGGVGAVAGVLMALWALFGDRSRGRRRCPRCWYDMKGVPGMRCPECGGDQSHERRLHRTRRHRRRAAMALALALLGAAGVATPRVAGSGWSSLVPVPVLSLALPLCHSQAKDALDGAAGGVAPKESRWQHLLICDEYARRLVAQGSFQGLPNVGFYQYGRAAAPIVPAAIDVMGRGDANTRRSAVEILGQLMLEPRRSVPALARALDDEDALVRQRAGAALFAFFAGGDSRQSGLIADTAGGALARRLTDDTDVEVRRASVRLLAEVAARRPVTIAAAGAALRDEDVVVRRMSIALLRLAGGEGVAVRSQIERALDDPDEIVRSTARRALDAMWP